MPIVQCLLCDKNFYNSPKRLAKTKFPCCSRKCSNQLRKSKSPEAWCVCKQCNKEFRTNPAYIKRRPNQNRFCSTQCFKIFLKTKGVYLSNRISSGYYTVNGTGKAERYHRFIMEKYLKRKLLTDEHVHHINGNKLDNRIENLIILDASTHHRLHHTPKGLDGLWAYCKKCKRPIWMSPSYIKHSYGGDRSRVKNYLCKNCGGGGRTKNYEDHKTADRRLFEEGKAIGD